MPPGKMGVFIFRGHTSALIIRYSYPVEKNMARAESKSRKNPVTTHPVLTGERRSDSALWQLSSVLAEIAELSIGKKLSDNSSDDSKSEKTGSTRQVSIRVENVDNV